ncbi:FHA domain-containing protein [Desulfosediminicola flagellatus]|uniref:FHA domain-containing protein n=1 Tax=Desulfosediminicola flagellatus TaxID=2569541 RepID=UPI0010AB94CF|nr:FHA domain-containing protein [Desulfosediminicola flagellatus]
MDEKRKILDIIQPRAVLQAMTDEAIEAIPVGQRIEEYVVIRKFPFKVGRESRVRKISGNIERVERSRNTVQKPSNDLYLVDKGQPLNISREHVQIEKVNNGYRLVDRASACGTKLEGEPIGGRDRGGMATLHDGDIFALGTAKTPYLFRFIALEDEFDWKRKKAVLISDR